METLILRLGLAGFMKQALRWMLLLAVALILITPPVVDAQVPQTVTTSITSTTGTGDLGTIVTHQVGSHLFNITDGKRPDNGPNLFHSFGSFTVGSGDTANFLNNTGFTTTNILSRVTNPGDISYIYGTIQTNGIGGFGNANLFLINPSGIVFGPHGSVNVGGSVSFTTAQYLRLFDGVNSANFYANPASDGLANSVLAVAPVVDFGFLSPAAYGFLTPPDPNATITVQGSALSVPSGQSISLVGGNISIQAGTLENGTSQAATLSAPSGRINLASVASGGEVLYPSLQLDPNVTGGTIALSQGTTLDVSGSGNVGSGVVVIRGGQLMIDQSSIIANTVDGNGANPGIDIQVSQDLSLTKGAVIISSTSGAGRGGDVAIVAGTVQMAGASITSAKTGSGRGGDISINVQTASLTDGAQIVSRTDGLGDGGDITISATETVSISGFDTTGTLSGITTALFDASTFAPVVTSGVFTTASAGRNGGSISITAPVIAVDNGGTIATINTGGGRGGDVALDGNTISVTNGGQLLTSTGLDYATLTPVGTGPGGDVTVTGTDSILLSGINPNLVSLLTGFAASSIQSVTFSGSGNGGNITANVKTLGVTDGAVIQSQNFSPGIDLTGDGVVDVAGVGGNVTVQGLQGLGSAAKAVTLDGSAQITTQTSFGPGQGGNISITADTLQLNNQSHVTSDTSSGTGKGGDLTLNVGTLLTVSGGSLVRTSDGSSGFDGDFDGVVDPTSVGSGGNLTIQGINGAAAGSVVLSGGSLVGTEAQDGAGGSLSIKTSVLSLDGASSIFTSTSGFGHGGNIDLRVQQARLGDGATIVSHTSTFDPNAGVGGTITLQGLDGNETNSLALSGFFSGIISDSAGLAHPGDIEVHAKTVSLTDQAVIAGGTPLTSGTGGKVTIDSALVSITGGSQISSQAFAQNAGTVTITANQLTLDNGSIVTTSASPVFGRGGDVVVHVGNVSLANGSTINSSTSQTGPAGDIMISAGQSVTVDSGSSITANTTGQGNAGNVLLIAGAVTVTNGSKISTSAQPSEDFTGQPSDLTGKAGNIAIATTGNSLLVSNGGTIASVSQTGGNAGSIGIITPSLTLDNGIITTSASSTGNAGDITITTTGNTLSLANGSQISSASTGTVVSNPDGTTKVPGTAGTITITDAGSFTSDASTVATSAEANHGGDISITAQNVQLSNGTKIDASTNGPLEVTKLVLDQNGQLVPEVVGEGNAGNVTITTPTLNLGNATITTSTTSSGNAGSITANVGTLTLTNAAEISSSSTGTASGNAGSITIQGLASPADAVTITNSSLLTKAEGSGQGGDISVSGLTITLNNATISATANAGNAGSVTIKDANTVQSNNSSVTTESTTGAGGSITIDAGNLINLSGTTISAKVTGGTKDGGNITFNAGNAGQQVTMENGTVVSAQSLSTDKNAGDAGTVTVNAGNQFLMNNSTITTESTNAGGGRVEINVADGFMVQLINSGIKTSVFGGSDTKGGNINIDPQFVILQNSQILAQAVAGAGGAITITATSAFIEDPDSIVSASSTLGISGEVNIQSPVQNVGGQLTPMAQEFSSAAALLAQQCAARAADGKFSTFVVAGREGLPVEPGGFLASPSMAAELFRSSLSGRDPHTQFSAVTGLFTKYDARPIQLAKYRDACHQ